MRWRINLVHFWGLLRPLVSRSKPGQVDFNVTETEYDNGLWLCHNAKAFTNVISCTDTSCPESTAAVVGGIVLSVIQ